jgi:hypothetical protein
MGEWMDVSGQLHVPVGFLSGNVPLVTTYKGLRDWVGARVGEDKNLWNAFENPAQSRYFIG